MEVVEPRTPSEFLSLAGPLLEISEARHNLIYGVTSWIESYPDVYNEFAMWVVSQDSTPVAAAVRTAPHLLTIADVASDDAIAPLVAAVARQFPDLPVAHGNVPTIDRFVEAWTAATGSVQDGVMAQGVFQLDRVAEVQTAPGGARPIRPVDLELLVTWIQDFQNEAMPAEASPRKRIEQSIRRRIEGGDELGMWVWELDGIEVSMSGFGGPTPNGIRIGPVYTPPQHRGHGYATALVAAQSSWLLEHGRRFCFVFTDLANPTSNRMYQRIGYRQIAEAARVGFRRPAPY